MKDRFKLAANVVLKRRLNNLLRIDDTISIDKTYITCAEYQLFLDEKRKVGENYQPEHWQSNRFPSGYSQKPITGIRASDAEAFCEWLTQQNFELGCNYRIPTLTEIEEHTASEKNIGCWCKNGEKNIVFGIETFYWEQWKMDLMEDIIPKFMRHQENLFPNFNIDLDYSLNHVLNPKFNSYFNPHLNSEQLDNTLTLRLNQEGKDYLGNGIIDLINCALESNLDGLLESLFTSNFNRILYGTLYAVLNSNANRILEPDLYHFVFNLLNPNLNILLKYELNYKSDYLLDVFRFYSLLVFLVFDLLSKIYDTAIKNRKVLGNIKLTYSQCKYLSNTYSKKREEAFNLYAFLRLMTERKTAKMPAWEGIRIVRERDSL
ncbi:MAG: SUMF1/EgtB/PvdO family nonheme iron enzyme [Crocosphaera sp.]|nr:SUMF1/EgtB/PvdO family nonheme iron enzyme [Crocosphaera sp.]